MWLPSIFWAMLQKMSNYWWINRKTDGWLGFKNDKLYAILMDELTNGWTDGRMDMLQEWQTIWHWWINWQTDGWTDWRTDMLQKRQTLWHTDGSTGRRTDGRTAGCVSKMTNMYIYKGEWSGRWMDGQRYRCLCCKNAKWRGHADEWTYRHLDRLTDHYIA